MDNLELLKELKETAKTLDSESKEYFSKLGEIEDQIIKLNKERQVYLLKILEAKKRLDRTNDQIGDIETAIKCDRKEKVLFKKNGKKITVI